MKSRKTKLYKLDWGQHFIFASDPKKVVYKLERGNGMYHWVTRVNERGQYSAYIGSEVIPVKESDDGSTS